MKILIKYLLVLCTLQSVSQNRNAIWCFGDSAGINWLNPQQPQFFVSAAKTRGTSVSIADTNGNLLFYAYTRATLPGRTGRVFNSSHQLMQNGDSLVGEGWYHEMVIVPDLTNNDRYYLFTISVTGPDSGLYYAVIDMSLDNGLGAVVQKNVPLFTGQLMTDCLTAIKHGNGRDWWVIARPSDFPSGVGNTIFVKYKVDPSGINGPFIQNIGSLNKSNAGNLTFSSTGDKVIFTNFPGLIDQFDFDRCTGLLSNYSNIRPVNSANPCIQLGAALSFNDQVLYTTTTVPQYALFQYDLTAPNILATETLIDTLPSSTDSVGPGLLQLAPDNKIYWGHQYYNGTYFFPYPDTIYNIYNMNLSVINSPDSLGAACNFQPFSFYLGGARTYYGLPNNPNYDLGISVGNPCPVSTAELVSENQHLPFPNPTSGMLTIPGLQHATLLVKDASGRLVKRIKTDVAQLDLSELQNGLYIIHSESTGVNYRISIIK